MNKPAFIVTGWRVEIWRKLDKSWNWRAYDIRTARTNPKCIENACYRTYREAVESARDWVSQQPKQGSSSDGH